MHRKFLIQKQPLEEGKIVCPYTCSDEIGKHWLKRNGPRIAAHFLICFTKALRNATLEKGDSWTGEGQVQELKIEKMQKFSVMRDLFLFAAILKEA